MDGKTLKAYRIDLCQFSAFAASSDSPLAKYCIAQYIQILHQKYKAKTAKRKIACLRAFFNYLEFDEFDEQIETNPISKIRLDFREEIVLPKALPSATIKKLLKCAYASLENNQTELQHNAKLRDVAILELLLVIVKNIVEKQRNLC